jgi:hypothetical protein
MKIIIKIKKKLLMRIIISQKVISVIISILNQNEIIYNFDMILIHLYLILFCSKINFMKIK